MIKNKGNFELEFEKFKEENYTLKKELRRESLYHNLFSNHNSVMLVINAGSGCIIDANKAAITYYGYTKEQITSMNIKDINMLEENDIKKEMALALSQSKNCFKFKHRLANNTIRDVVVHSIPVKGDTDNLLFSIVYDSDEKIKQNLMFDQLLLASPYAVAILDKEQRMVNINDSFTKMFSYNYDETEGKFINDLLSPYNNNQIDKNIKKIYQGEIVKGESKRRHKNGHLIDVDIIGYPVLYHQDVIGAYIIYTDISHKLRDALTGLYNRNYFIEEIDKQIKYCTDSKEVFSVIVIGIKNFKDINDTLGHIIGDKFLKEITKRLKSVLTEKHLISRVDGDEFAILINNASKSALLHLCYSILHSLNQPYVISNTNIYLYFNIGISTFPKDGTNSADLIRFSNIALQQAKIESNNRVSFYNNIVSQKMEQRFFIANFLFSAISNKELSIYYQPIFNINDKAVVGAEALLRWNNVVLGEVPPSDCIPVAEKTGLIISIGEWVIKKVCKQINLWKQKKIKLVPISINISVYQLENIGFAKSILNIIDSNNIEPGIIEFEITESVSSGDISKIVNNIKELKKHGIKMSMDDFGTGFSSLSQLDIFELDKLKIDKIFIDDIVNGGIKRQNLVKSIIAMAQSLNLITVAEGIETSEQLYHLKGLGCQLGQGFVFSKPLIVKDIEELLKKEGI